MFEARWGGRRLRRGGTEAVCRVSSVLFVVSAETGERIRIGTARRASPAQRELSLEPLKAFERGDIR